MSAPEIATIGVGAVDPKRLTQSIDLLVQALRLPATPPAARIFDASYLPPIGERPKSTR